MTAMKSQLLLVLLGIMLGCALGRYQVHKRGVSEKCSGLLSAVKNLLSNIESTRTKCMIDMMLDTVIEFDIYDEDKLEELVCLIADNSENADALFKALDNHGIVDKFIRVAYAYGATSGSMGMAALRGIPYSMKIQKCLHNDYQGSSGPGLAIFDDITPEEFERLADVVSDLGIFSLDPERTRAAASAISGSMYMSIPTIDDPCECSAITDSKQRCNMGREAVEPFVDLLISNPMFSQYINMGSMFITQYTGVTLLANPKDDMLDVFCKMAQIQTIDDVRRFLDDLGVTQPGIELGFSFLMNHLASDSFKSQQQYTIDQGEEDQSSEYSYWRPSKEQVVTAKAMLALSDAIRELDLQCQKLTYVSAMVLPTVQTACTSGSGSNPYGPYSN